MNTTNHFHSGSDFQEKYKALTDEELKQILINREGYQPAAVSAAIEEAMDRKIISSEQDLFSEEYTPTAQKKSIFPFIQHPQQKIKILASITRITYISGIIPFVYGALTYYRFNKITGVGFIAIGICWLLLNYMFSKTRKLSSLYGLISILTVGFGYTLYSIVKQESSVTMDFVIASAAFIILLYCLLFARSILKNK